MRLSIQAICNIGLVRGNNEDALSVGGLFLRDDSTSLSINTPEDGCFYLLVSDGMGGHENGEEASQYTLDTIQDKLRGIPPESFEDGMRELVKGISDNLNRQAFERGQIHPMGCTLTGVIWHFGRIWLVNAGDSRTYRFREGMLRQLTTDETERGITGNPEASKLLLNCIGGGSHGRLSVSDAEGKLLEGDTILICSDGLCDMVSDDDIETALSGGASAIDLLSLAHHGGGVDNISIILAKIEG